MKHGRLMVLGEAMLIDRRRGRYLFCRCDCGVEKLIRKGAVVSGNTKSCGCGERDNRIKHGAGARGGRTPEYRSWESMIQRCKEKRSAKWYAERGITVCERWRDFANFLADMGTRPSGTSLDRINNDLGYEPGNCRWATPNQQNANRRVCKQLEHGGLRMTASEWSRRLGMSRETIVNRLRSGWPMDRVLAPPIKKQHNFALDESSIEAIMFRFNRSEPCLPLVQ